MPPGSSAYIKIGSSLKSKHNRTPNFNRRRYMVVKTNVGEYFGLVDPTGIIAENWNDLPDDRPVLVNKYCPRFGSGQAQIELISKKFIKGKLQLLREQLASKQMVLNLFNQSNEEDFMSTSANLIKAAKEGGVQGVEEQIKAEIAAAVKRALWVARKQDEFVAQPILEELTVKYGGAKVTTSSEAPKDGKAIKLSKTDKVDSRVWDAILKKVAKIGAITKSTPNRAECVVDKKEADTFIKAAKAVVGITVE